MSVGTAKWFNVQNSFGAGVPDDGLQRRSVPVSAVNPRQA